MNTLYRSFHRTSYYTSYLPKHKKLCFISNHNSYDNQVSQSKKQIVIVGGGIAAMMSAYHQSRDYDVTILEERDKLCQLASKSNAGNICPGRVKNLNRFDKLPFRKVIDNFDLYYIKLTKWLCMNFLYSYFAPNHYNKNKIYRDLAKSAIEVYEDLLKAEDFDHIYKKTDLNYHFKGAKLYNEELNYYRELNLPHELNELKENIDHYSRSKKDYREGKTQADNDNYSVHPEPFNTKLEEILRKRGVNFKLNSKVIKVQTLGKGANSLTDHVLLENGEKIQGDIFVICSNNKDSMFQFSDVPHLPLTSFSWTLDATPERLAIYDLLPKKNQSIFIDAITNHWYIRWGDKIRVVGSYWVVPKKKFIDRDWEKMKGTFQFPVKKEDATFCTRTCSADILPVISRHSNISNLYINSIYGNLGWTLSAYGGLHQKNQIEGKMAWNPLSHERFTFKQYAKAMIQPKYGTDAENKGIFG